jgi:quinol monooxygenase YgiN
MPYIRLSLARPRRGETTAHVEAAFRQIAELAGTHPGCLESYVLKPHDDSGEIARIAIYQDETSAEHAASNDAIMALRSELDLIVDPRSHQERAFFSID